MTKFGKAGKTGQSGFLFIIGIRKELDPKI
jgi:hypothetical protein